MVDNDNYGQNNSKSQNTEAYSLQCGPENKNIDYWYVSCPCVHTNASKSNSPKTLYKDFRTPLPFSVVQNNFWNMYDILFSLADAAAVYVLLHWLYLKIFSPQRIKTSTQYSSCTKQTVCYLQVNMYCNVNKVPALQK